MRALAAVLCLLSGCHSLTFSAWDDSGTGREDCYQRQEALEREGKDRDGWCRPGMGFMVHGVWRFNTTTAPAWMRRRLWKC